MSDASLTIHAEHCAMAGREVPRNRVDEHLEENGGRLSDDWLDVHVSEEEARWYESRRGDFGRKVAATIRRHLEDRTQ